MFLRKMEMFQEFITFMNTLLITGTHRQWLEELGPTLSHDGSVMGVILITGASFGGEWDPVTGCLDLE